MNTLPVISVTNLTRRYDSHVAVDGLTFTVNEGEVFGLLGPNGAGKTTTLLMLLGLTEASSGDVQVLGMNPQRTPLAVKEKVGYMPDSVGFYDHLSARQNLLYTAKLLGIPASAREQRVEQALDRVALLDKADQRTGTYSHGMRRRLGLAEIVLKQARVAILDEPTSGLDPQSTESFLELIKALKQDGVTVLLSSHMLDQVQRICDRVALFNHGRIALSGSVDELAAQVIGTTQRVSLHIDGGIDLYQALARIEGVNAVRSPTFGHYLIDADRDVRSRVAQIALAQGARIHTLSAESISLDTIYRRYFSETGVTA